MSDAKTLTYKQQRFVEEFLIDFNATQAAIRAGYSARTAQAIGAENLTKPLIGAALTERKQRLDEKAGLTTERAARQLAMSCFYDMRKMFDPKGAFLPIHELDEETAAGIAAFDVVEMAGALRVDAQNGTGHVPMYTKKVKLVDKIAALGLVMRHLGMLKDRIEHTGADGGPLRFNMAALSTLELEQFSALAEKAKAAVATPDR